MSCIYEGSPETSRLMKQCIERQVQRLESLLLMIGQPGGLEAFLFTLCNK